MHGSERGAVRKGGPYRDHNSCILLAWSRLGQLGIRYSSGGLDVVRHPDPEGEAGAGHWHGCSDFVGALGKEEIARQTIVCNSWPRCGPCPLD